MWNASFDVHHLFVDGITVKSKIIDAQLGSHLLNENIGKEPDTYDFPLKPMADKCLGYDASLQEREMEAQIGGKANIHKADPEIIAPYACQDTDLTWEMFCYNYEGLKKQNLLGIWNELSDYTALTIEMEKEGALIDQERVKRALETLVPDQAKQLAELRQLVGDPKFNPNSHVQCKKLFGLDLSDKCDKEFLELLGTPAAKGVLTARAFTKIKGSFYVPFSELADANGRIHPSIKLFGTGPGRPSCTQPNLQALPRENDFFNVRSMIISPPGYSILSCDWSQIELRLLAHYSQDPNLIKAYMEDMDIHQMTSDLLNVDRDWAKRLNFGVTYGLAAPGFMKQARVTKKVAERTLDAFHGTYPNVQRLYRACQKKAEEKGYITMWTGRRRRYPQAFEQRKAMSGLIQGGVAEVMRVSLTRLHNKFKDNPDVRLFLQVHDDVLAYVKDDVLFDVAREFRTILEDFDFKVPVKTEVKYGKSWGSLTKWKDV
jgi:DNA polymerase-1